MAMLEHQQMVLQEQRLLQSHGTSISTFSKEQKDIFYEPSRNCLKINKTRTLIDAYSLKGDSNSNLKALSVAILRLIFQNKKNASLCDHIKCHLYHNQTILTNIENIPYQKLDNQSMKKIFAEIFQILKSTHFQNKIYVRLTKYPMFLDIFVIYLRTILMQFNVHNANNYNVKLQTSEAFDYLIQFFDLDCLCLSNCYIFREEELVLSTPDDEQYLVGHYSQKKIESAVFPSRNPFMDSDQESLEQVVFDKKQRASKIITPQFQSLLLSEDINAFKKRKSGFHNIQGGLGPTNRHQDSIFKKIEKNQMNESNLWNQTHLQSQGQDEEESYLKINPEILKNKSRLVQSFQMDGLFTIVETESKKNIQTKQSQSETQKMDNNYKVNLNQIFKKPKQQSQKQIKKWYPYKKNLKTESDRIKNLKNFQKKKQSIKKKLTLDSDVLGNLTNSQKNKNKKKLKNHLYSNILSITYFPPYSKIVSPHNIIWPPYQRVFTQNKPQRASIILFKKQTILPKCERLSPNEPALLGTKSIIKISPRHLTKSPISKHQNKKSQIQYSRNPIPTNRTEFKPKVSFIYGSPINREILSKSPFGRVTK